MTWGSVVGMGLAASAGLPAAAAEGGREVPLPRFTSSTSTTIYTTTGTGTAGQEAGVLKRRW